MIPCRGAALALLALCMTSTCAPESGKSVRIVLVTVDTLRYDDAIGNGTTTPAMPRLLARATRGASFSRFYAASSVTQPTHASMFTALHPWQHGITRNGLELGESLITIAEAMQEGGFETRAVVASFPCASRFGFGQGFDQYRETFTSGYPDQDQWAGRELPEGGFFCLADAVTEGALQELDEASDPQQFFWFHYFDPHGPYGDSQGDYLVDEIIFERIRKGEDAATVLAAAHELYRADVSHLDRSLDRVLARLEADSAEFETHVLLVSDHGESLGEGGSISHGNRLSDCEIHIPCVLLSPRIQPGVRTDVAGSVDVAPTLLSLAELPPWHREGRDLTDPNPSSTGASGMRRTFQRDDPAELRLDGRYHRLPSPLFYFVDPAGEIYRGNAEIWAQRPAPEADAIRTLFATFEVQLTGQAPVAEMDPETEEALRALGYVK